jgi:2-phospho-L-lactate guanylyltransferase
MSGNSDLWSIVMPVKLLDVAKSRLLVESSVRAELALAMASDAVQATLECAAVGEVLIVTDDDRAAAVLGELGARIVADSPTAGLNPAVTHGVAAAAYPHAAAMTSDLPSLLASELAAVLALAAPYPRAVVADSDGTGTTLLTATAGGELAPRFGAGSRAAHLATGAVDLTDRAGRTVRLDVDTVEALREAIAVGVGPHTARVVDAYVT